MGLHSLGWRGKGGPYILFKRKRPNQISAYPNQELAASDHELVTSDHDLDNFVRLNFSLKQFVRQIFSFNRFQKLIDWLIRITFCLRRTII